MSTINDSTARQQALDIMQSFIVQAPAGSGKTELLTQRYLALLAKVDRTPEQVLAITFTRKAAQEMRTRIINALHTAQNENEPTSAHAETTWKLAHAVLERDKKERWELLANPNRLMIKTIDSLCASITQQMPILAEFGAQPIINDNPEIFYLEAAKQVLQSGLLENVAWQKATVQLLQHLDNNLKSAQQLLAAMLQRREQWLHYVVNDESKETLKIKLEATLQTIIKQNLFTVAQAMPFTQKEEFLALLRFSGSNVEMANDYRAFEKLTDLPSADYSELAMWQKIAKWLLTTEGKWRKRFDKSHGFPAPSSTKNKEEKELFERFKQRAADLMAAFQAYPNLEEKLAAVNILPAAYYTEEAWELISALIELLPMAVAHLTIIFSKQSAVDFTHITQAALRALGTEDEATDLALALDYRLQHILVDEFQDTSFVQWELLEKLIAGWQNKDGRTLFLVGDPMQSIYRFRQAEVGLFLKARENGIGNVILQSLLLTSNFRSQKELIQAINDHFSKIFPKESDVGTGAVHYMPAVAQKEADSLAKNPMAIHFVQDDMRSEAEKVAQLVKEYYEKHPQLTIAILVRARTHLTAILPALNQNQIPFSAVEIEALSERPVIQDLLALACALLHLADKTAWLSLLRAPWCGLTLAEILKITEASQNNCVWDALNKDDIAEGFAEPAKIKLTRIKQIFDTSLKEAGRQSLRDWIYSAWLALGGPGIYANQVERENATTFFELITKLEKSQQTISRKVLYEAVEKLYAKANSSQHARIQVMTIHKSKGLEFDVVIMPGLDKKSANNERKLLEWLEVPAQNQLRTWLFSALPEKNSQADAIHNYVRGQNNIKEQLELARVFYVGVTRAKKQVHLVAQLTETEAGEIKQPASSSILGLFWNNLDNPAQYQEQMASTFQKTGVKSSLKRITLDWQLPHELRTFMPFAAMHFPSEIWKPIDANNPDKHYTWQYNIARYTGTLVHEILYCIGTQGWAYWKKQDITQYHEAWKTRLRELGVNSRMLSMALQQVNQTILAILQDETGEWIFSDQHSHAECEYAVSGMLRNRRINVRIDRTFIDTQKNERWIIDYKTSLPEEGQSMAAFLEQEKNTYTSQLIIYQSLLKMRDTLPVRIGLYFPLLKIWQEVSIK